MPFDGYKFQRDEETKLDDDVTQFLIKARERIERGWCQGTMRQHWAVCIVGALNYAAPSGIWAGAVKRLERAAGVGPNSNLPYWNDRPGRTKEEVLAVYDVAIYNG